MPYLGTYGIALASCRDCNRHGNVFVWGFVCAMHEQLSVLAHNLAVAAWLCRAYYDGFSAGCGPRPPLWSPGCNLPSHGSAGEG